MSLLSQDHTAVVYHLIAFSFVSFNLGFLWAVVLFTTLLLVRYTAVHDPKDCVNDTCKELKVKRKRLSTYFKQQKFQIHERDMPQFSKENHVMVMEKTKGKPSLTSLIHRGTTGSDRHTSSQQPLLAVLKNNTYLRNHPSEAIQKSPLYQSMSPSKFGSLCNSPLAQMTFSPLNRLKKTPTIDYTGFNVQGHTFNNGLEVHGSYFLNKSLLQENADEKNFSLISAKFSSSDVYEMQSVSNISVEEKQNNPVDRTSTHAVVSALKSKRKRHLPPTNTESDEYSKRIKLNSNNDMNSTLEDLFPPMLSSGSPLRKRISNIRTTSKRLVSTATQCDKLEQEEVKLKKKKIETATECEISPGRSKFGITLAQTNELYDESMDQTNVSDDSVIIEKVESENHALSPENNNKVLTSSPNATEINEKKKVSFSNNSSPEPQKKVELKHLKTPYRKILSLSSDIMLESSPRFRTRPVFYSEHIDVDEIQSNREEFGLRGVSHEAYLVDKKESMKRINEFLDESDEVDFHINKPKDGASMALQGTPASSTASVVTTPQISFGFTPAPPLTTSSMKSFSTPSTTSLALNNEKKIPEEKTPVLINSPTKAFTGIGQPVLFGSQSDVKPVASSLTVISHEKNIFGSVNTTTNVLALGSTSNIFATGISSTSSSSTSSSFTFGSTASNNLFKGISAVTTAVTSASTLFNTSFTSINGSTPVSSSIFLGKPQTNIVFGTPSTATNSIFSTVSSISSTNSVFGGLPSVKTSTSFGSLTSSSNLLAAASTTSKNSIFLPTVSKSSVFGSSELPPSNSLVGNIFATSTAVTAPNIFSGFGKTPVSSTASSVALFGAPSSMISSVFIAPSSQLPSFFGTQPSQQSNVFNNPTTTVAGFNFDSVKSSGFNFGGVSSNSALFPPASNSVFSQPTQNVFGSTTTTTTSANVFGSDKNNAAMFTQQKPAFNFGSAVSTGTNNGFSFSVTSQSSSIFGAAASTASVFGNNSSSSFGAPGNAFGSSGLNTSNLFNQPVTQQKGFDFSSAAKPTLNFGGSSSNVFGSTNDSAKPSFNFGPATNHNSQQPTTPSFNFGTGAPSFARTPSFGTPSAQSLNHSFNTPNNAGGFSIGAGNTTPGTGRPLSRARRRMKR